jgi:hypothetical protein
MIILVPAANATPRPRMQVAFPQWYPFQEFDAASTFRFQLRFKAE